MKTITSERYHGLNPAHFPNLEREGCSVESPQDEGYNCIAWAAGEDSRWWEPYRDYYWPPNIPEEPSVTAFTLLFEELGYRVCRDSGLEEGYEKVAIYALGGIVKHAARQLQNGRWTSKLGKYIDIEHTLEGIEGPCYGGVVKILKREL